jgi:hypothetical protein
VTTAANCPCGGKATEFGKHVFHGGFHVVERCVNCKRNVRGSAVWVPRQEVAVDPQSLPVFQDRRSAEQTGQQKTLF